MAEYTKGKNLMVFTSDDEAKTWKNIGYSTACELSLETDTIEVAGKYTGAATEIKPRMTSWTVTCAALMGAASFNALFSLWQERRRVWVMFDTVDDHPDGVEFGKATADGHLGYFGEAYITRLSASGDNGSTAKLSVTLSGTGEIKVLN